MAHIEQRGDSWRVEWRLGGRSGRKQSTTWPKPEFAQQAADIAAAHRHQITADQVYAAILGEPARVDERATPTVRAWANTWIGALTRPGPGQIRTYRGQLDREILPALGDKQLHEVAGTDIGTLLNTLRTRFKDSTVTRYYACIHAMFAAAHRDGLIDDNPARRTDFVRDLIAHDDATDDGDDHVYLTRHEYELLLAAMPAGARTLVQFLAETGARFSEGAAVAVGAVDVFTRRVRVHRAWKFDGKRWYLGATKGRVRRSVSIGARLVDALTPLVASEPVTALLFRAPEGGRVVYTNFLSRVWDPAVVAAMRCPLHPPAARGRQVDESAAARCGGNGGVVDNGSRAGQPCGRHVQRGWDRCHDHAGPTPEAVSTCDCPTRLTRRPTPHDLRHSHVAWLIAKGRPIASISRRIGHHSTKITEQVYAGILPEVSDSDAAAVDDFLSSPGGASAAASYEPSETARS